MIKNIVIQFILVIMFDVGFILLLSKSIFSSQNLGFLIILLTSIISLNMTINHYKE